MDIKFKQMKKTNSTLIFIGTILFFLFACSEKKDELGKMDITIELDKQEILANGSDVVNIKVLADGVETTESVEIFINDETYASMQFSTTNVARYKVTAEIGDNKSDDYYIFAIDENFVPEDFTKKILIEDYTGTWCGWCPMMVEYINNAKLQSNNIVSIGIHYNDAMEFSLVENLMSKFNITGFPTAMIERSTDWKRGSFSELQTFLDKKAKIGIALNTTINNNNLDIATKVKFNENMLHTTKLVVLLVEDKLIYSQRNYLNDDASSVWYQAGDPIDNFEHNDVLRENLTDIYGDDISSKYCVKGGIYETSYSVDLSDYNAANCKIVAFVVAYDNGDNEILNTQEVHAGSNINF